jgi:hypothetical protein
VTGILKEWSRVLRGEEYFRCTLGTYSCFVLWRLVIEEKCMATIVMYHWNVLSVKYSFTAEIEVICFISEFVG